MKFRLIHYVDGQTVDVPLLYNVNTTDWWELGYLPHELPEAVTAWRGSNGSVRSSGRAPGIRLFKHTWENPRPGVEVTSIDFIGEHPKTFAFLVALTAE